MDTSVPSVTCFICCKKVCDTVSSTTRAASKRAFKHMSNFLRDFKTTNNKFESAQLKLAEFCTECSQLLERFNQVYLILEETRFWLNYYIEGVVRLMTKVSSECYDSRQSQAQLGNDLQDYRKDFLDFCHKRLSYSIPRVILSRVQLPSKRNKMWPNPEDFENFQDDVSTASDNYELVDAPVQRRTKLATNPKDIGNCHDDLSTASDIFDDIHSNPPTPAADLSSPVDKIHQEDAKDQTQSTTRVVNIIVKSEAAPCPDDDLLSDCSENRESDHTNSTHEIVRRKDLQGTSETHISNQFARCSYCPGRRLYDATYFRRHLAVQHREHTLLKYKLDSIPTTQFKLIVDKHLFRDLLKSESCLVCNKVFSYTKLRELYISNHWINNHHDTLRDKVIELQNNQELLKELSNVNSETLEESDTKPQPGFMDCDLCGIRLKTESLRAHLRNYCKGNKKRLKEVQCSGCLKWMSKDWLVSHNRLRLCKGVQRESTNRRVTTVICKACAERMSVSNWEDHKLICRKSKGTQESQPEYRLEDTEQSSLVCDKCGKKFARYHTLLHHQKFACPLLPKTRAKCERCQKILNPNYTKHHKCLETPSEPTQANDGADTAAPPKFTVVQSESQLKTKETHPNLHICKCGKDFTVETNLHYHQKYNCPMLPKTQTQCDGCGRKMDPRSLKRHKRRRNCGESLVKTKLSRKPGPSTK